MMDFARARRMMVDGQVRTCDVFDANLLEAMLEIPRERFVAQPALAYLDLDAPLGSGRRRLLKPMVLARLLQFATIAASDHVLDVACATGYSSALLARLAGSVIALEQDPELSKWARHALAELAPAVTLVEGPLNAGWPPLAPYDVIMVNGAVATLPPALLHQLAEGGRLVAILGEGPASKAMLYRCSHGETSGRPVFDAAAPTLPGFSSPEVFAF